MYQSLDTSLFKLKQNIYQHYTINIYLFIDEYIMFQNNLHIIMIWKIGLIRHRMVIG